jgi:hypothetical protein|tara:strand:+ start:6350 stop:6769 length:420 start_codon:yes stop_codon:yes gene_type:complete
MSNQTCLIIPSNSSSYSSWIEWHKALKKCVGSNNANQLWMMNFDKEMPEDNFEVREYMRAQGVDLDRSALDRITDFGGGVYSFVGGTFNFAGNVTKVVLLMIIAGAGIMVYNIVKSPEGSVRLATAIGTRGMSEGIPKK